MTEWVVAAGRNVSMIAVEFIREYVRKYREMNARWYDYVFGGGKKGSILLHMRSGLLVEVRHPRLSLKMTLTFLPIGEVVTLAAITIVFATMSLPLLPVILFENVSQCVTAGVVVISMQWALFARFYFSVRTLVRTSVPSGYEREFMAGLSGLEERGQAELPSTLPSWWAEHVEDIVFWSAVKWEIVRTLGRSVVFQTLVWLTILYVNAGGA